MSDAMTAAPGHAADAAGISRVRSQGGIVTTVARLRTWTSDNSLIGDGRCASLARNVAATWQKLGLDWMESPQVLHASHELSVYDCWRARRLAITSSAATGARDAR